MFQQATRSITIVDAYADGTIFRLLAPPAQGALRVEILCSRYGMAVAAEAKRFVAQFPTVAIEVRSSTREFHDRFIIVDQRDCVHVGASIKDAGSTAFMISKVEDEANRLALLTSVNAAWGGSTVVA